MTIATQEESPATIAELATLQFAAEMDGLSDKEIGNAVRNRADELRSIGYIAMAMLRLDKEELVIKAREKPDVFMDFCEHCTYAKDLARDMSEMFSSAEARLFIALSTVAEDGGRETT